MQSILFDVNEVNDVSSAMNLYVLIIELDSLGLTVNNILGLTVNNIKTSELIKLATQEVKIKAEKSFHVVITTYTIVSRDKN